uniref:Uncharacterized protein n=1 Tax=Vespula pensylvanica TaxID=30213 RepID=A0A834UDB4_VESPE|nr:hypothetical protein H0235_004776 [Vespula pensylvanica]
MKEEEEEEQEEEEEEEEEEEWFGRLAQGDRVAQDVSRRSPCPWGGLVDSWLISTDPAVSSRFESPSRGLQSI